MKYSIVTGINLNLYFALLIALLLKLINSTLEINRTWLWSYLFYVIYFNCMKRRLWLSPTAGILLKIPRRRGNKRFLPSTFSGKIMSRFTALLHPGKYSQIQILYNTNKQFALLFELILSRLCLVKNIVVRRRAWLVTTTIIRSWINNAIITRWQPI